MKLLLPELDSLIVICTKSELMSHNNYANARMTEIENKSPENGHCRYFFIWVGRTGAIYSVYPGDTLIKGLQTYLLARLARIKKEALNL